MFNYNEAICGVMLLTDTFYADIIDADHNYHHVPLVFADVLELLTDKNSRALHIRKTQHINAISVKLCRFPDTLSDNALSAIFTTVLHRCASTTMNILPNVGLCFSSNAVGTYWSPAVDKNLPIFPELYTLMDLVPDHGTLNFELLDVNVLDAYDEVMGDICYVPVLLSKLKK